MGQNCSAGGVLEECPEITGSDNWQQSHEFFTGIEEDALDIVTMITASVSCCGSLFIILTFLRFEQVRTFPFRLVLHLSICDLLANMWFLPLFVSKLQGIENRTDEPDGWCYAIGGITQFFTIAGFVWTVIISYNVYFSLILESSSHNQHMSGYHAVTWGVAAIFTAIPAIVPQVSASMNNGTTGELLAGYGFYNNWCWIANDAKLLIILVYDIPLFLTIALICFFNCYAIRGVRSTHTTVEGLRGKLELKLHLYIIVFVVSRSFGIVNRIAQLAAPCCPYFVLWVLQEVFTPLQGLGNAIVYGLNYTVRTLYRVRLCDRQRLAASPHAMHRIRRPQRASIQLEQIRTLQRTISKDRSDEVDGGKSKLYALVPSPPAQSPSRRQRRSHQRNTSNDVEYSTSHNWAENERDEDTEQLAGLSAQRATTLGEVSRNSFDEDSYEGSEDEQIAEESVDPPATILL